MVMPEELRLQADFLQLLERDNPLCEISEWVWSELQRGSRDRNHPWNLGCISTVERQKSGELLPRSRTVVLRGVDTGSRTLDFYTDGRSAKVCSLLDPNVTPRVCWLFYRHETRVQVRVDGRCEILARDQAEEYWKSTPSDSHKLYATKDPPGTRMENQLPNDPEYDFDRAQDHFFVVRTRVENIDLVSLSSKGNRRLTIEYEDLSLPARLSWRTP